MNSSETERYIIITGAAGFIGSRVAKHLNRIGYKNLVLVDDFSITRKRSNWTDIAFFEIIDRQFFTDWLVKSNIKPDFIIHLGARTDTLEYNYSIHNKLNVVYSKLIWSYCCDFGVPLIYASSAATYGNGDHGYKDDHEVIKKLVPLNPYGISKNEFDKWVICQNRTPPFWVGLKFFNVYGPGENHKGQMASIIFHAYHQIKQKGSIALFKSYKPEFTDGYQLRDFIYINDILKVIHWMMKKEISSGIYNLGSGKACSFMDLADELFTCLNLKKDINFIDMSEKLRDKYQYFTEANMEKLRDQGYIEPFYTLEAGIRDYVDHLSSGS